MLLILVSVSTKGGGPAHAALSRQAPDRNLVTELEYTLIETHHRVHVLINFNQTLHQNRFRAVIFEELLHFCRKFGRRFAPNRVHAHGPGKQDEIGVRHSSVRIPRVIEQI
jgi:hypothetical protein